MRPPLALQGIRVLDLGTVVAGPGVAARLGDFGADVIKVEHPSGDTTRSLGWSVHGTTLWWKWIGRNKRPVTLNLSGPRGQDLLRRLAGTADVLVESFRPGTLERWGLAPESLLALNPRLVVLRVSGFGQTGPYSGRPGFGTLAESISGFAHMNGFPDGPPVLPPIALADEVSSLLGAFAVMVALYHRDREPEGPGQVIDLALFEALFQTLGPLPALFDQLGIVPGRIGNAIAYAAPRGAYPTKDGRWLGVSGTSQATAERVFAAIGRPELARDERFATARSRLEHRAELDALIEAWTVKHSLGEALAEFERHQAPAAPVYDISQIVSDPQYEARGTITRVPDDDLGEVAMAEVEPRLSATPGRIRHPGLGLGAANAEVYKELGLSDRDVDELRDEGVI